MNCPKCNTDNSDTKKFCRKCGTKLSIVCTLCKTENDSEDVFCGGCGKNLATGNEINYSNPKTYTPAPIAEKILTVRKQVEGERKLVTVFFADVTNYTAMSEKFDPEEVHSIIEGWYKIVMERIYFYEGTITQFMGDGVMALFGAPIAHEDHARRACLSALSIQEEVKGYAEKVNKTYGIDFKMRVGLNAGPVIVGSIGDDLKMDYTAIGDTVNLASRMESSAKPGTVQASVHVYNLVKDFFEINHLGKIQVKGKTEPQDAYEILKPGVIGTRIEASQARGLTRFIGRKKSKGILEGAFEKAKTGSGQVVSIVGDAGVGKSRLMLELWNSLDPEEYVFFQGQCLQYGKNIIYLPILDIVKSFFGIKEDDREYIIKQKVSKRILGLDKNLEIHIPPIQELLSLSVDDEEFKKSEPKKKRERVFEALRDILVTGSEIKTIIVVIEDLHWMDKTSEEFIGYLMDWIANKRVLMVLLYRPEYTHQWGSRSFYVQVGLDQLGPESSAELVKAMLEDGEVAPEVRDIIIKRASGNPFYMEEFTRSLFDRGIIEKKNERYYLKGNPSEIDVPETIQGIIAARMDRLEENLKRVMQVASVIGRDFAYRILQTITGMREDLKSNLLNLQGLEFIYEKRLFPELEYIFKHALTQEVAYNSLLIKRRKEIHEKIGEAIEKIYTDKLEEFYEILAYHYSMSENMDKAVEYLKKAGTKAVERFSYREGYDFYKQAIDILNKKPNIETNKRRGLEIRALFRFPSLLLNYPEGSLKVFQEGLNISEELEDKKNIALSNMAIGHYYVVSGDVKSAEIYAENSIKIAKDVGDLEIIFKTFQPYLISLQARGDYYKTYLMAPEILNLFEKSNSFYEKYNFGYNIYLYIIANYITSLAEIGLFDDADNNYLKAKKIALKENDIFTLGALELNYGIVLMIMGDPKSIIHCEASYNYFESGKINILHHAIYSFLCLSYIYNGNIDKSREYLKKCMDHVVKYKTRQYISWVYIVKGIFNIEIGDYKQAIEDLSITIDIGEKNNEIKFLSLGYLFYGYSLWKEDILKLEKSMLYIHKGIELLEQAKLKPWQNICRLKLAEIYGGSNQKDKALETLNLARTNFLEMGMDYWVKKTDEMLGKIKI